MLNPEDPFSSQRLRDKNIYTWPQLPHTCLRYYTDQKYTHWCHSHNVCPRRNKKSINQLTLLIHKINNSMHKIQQKCYHSVSIDYLITRSTITFEIIDQVMTRAPILTRVFIAVIYVDLTCATFVALQAFTLKIRIK